MDIVKINNKPIFIDSIADITDTLRNTEFSSLIEPLERQVKKMRQDFEDEVADLNDEVDNYVRINQDLESVVCNLNKTIKELETENNILLERLKTFEK